MRVLSIVLIQNGKPLFAVRGKEVRNDSYSLTESSLPDYEKSKEYCFGQLMAGIQDESERLGGDDIEVKIKWLPII